MSTLESSAGEPHQLSSDEFRDVIGSFASGVTVITTTVEGQPQGTTASAVSSLSLDPPMLLICMNQTSATGQAIQTSRAFAVNILGEDHHHHATRFARKGSEKFEGVDIRTGDHGQPLIADALAHLVCRVAEEVEAATHIVFIAEVHEATARPGAPLAYFRGQFGRLAFDPVASAAQLESLDPKDVARAYIAALNDSDFDRLRSLLDEDATLTICAAGIAGSGTHSGRVGIVDEFLRPVRGFFEPGDPKLEIRSIVADGPTVLVEARGRGKLKNGNTYDNQYALVFEIRDGSVHAVREYMDSHHAASVVT